MHEATLIPRFAAARLGEALADTPVVLIHGPRQCGKTWLAQTHGEAHGYAYLSFDDDNLLAAARHDPVGFVAELPAKVILDEIQRTPELFRAIKASIDRDRRPGRFLLTGSSNVLLVPKLADSLAGRMEALRLHPLAQAEIHRHQTHFLDAVFAAKFRNTPARRLGTALGDIILAGGYPAALQRKTARRRSDWYRSYLDSIVQRDVQELARISALDVMPQLLRVAASQTARLFNASQLAAPFQLTRPTIANYVALLERVFLIERLPPWHNNRLSRLIKTPKLHLCDTGVAAALLEIDSAALKTDRTAYGQLLETFVYQELRRLASYSEARHSFHHFRDKDDYEVDIVIERDSRVAGVEVKSASTVNDADFAGLRKLAHASQKRFTTGVVLYDGEHLLRFGERLFAVPISYLWSA